MTIAEDWQKTKDELVDELNRLRKRVSDLEHEEDTYRQTGELLHLLSINSPIGLFIIQDRKFVFTNKQFRNVFGFHGGELVGTYSLGHVHPEDREMVREKAKKMLKGELASPYKYRLISKDGQIRWMLEGVLSIQYQGKRAVLGQSLDITDRIETEVKLRELFENEKELRQKLEAEVNKRIEYTRALVHELKTP
ncbi:PAS domain S-box protein [Chloroflexota bacterium]